MLCMQCQQAMSSLRSTKQFCSTRCRVAWNRQRAAGLQPSVVPMGELQIPCLQLTSQVTLYCGDALQIAPRLPQRIDAVILDPPYGVAFDHTRVRRSTPHWTANVFGDDRPFDPQPWLRYPQVILWGANHYRLPAAHGWITWDKRGTKKADRHAGTDLAWSNIPGSTRTHEQLWRGKYRAGEENWARTGEKLHPQQKPIDLMTLCVSLTSGRVLDPYMGSGTTGEACLRLQRPYVGIEIDPHWFAVACCRLAAAAKQLQLFPAS
jgi:site-specific DNA-methyltransferase (adenine-specific)